MQLQGILLTKERVQGKTVYFVIKMLEQFGYGAKIQKLYLFRERLFEGLESFAVGEALSVHYRFSGKFKHVSAIRGIELETCNKCGMAQSAEDVQQLCTGCTNPIAERLEGVWSLADKTESVTGNH